ncbi:MAG: bifunctional diguanylate cyclase/phosphodiesterase [Desulfobulbaceae bacterium]|nr:bifunctional diguanylate cyclase/phosphodiesterase [Desulfobulbaceae bacterium]
MDTLSPIPFVAGGFLLLLLSLQTTKKINDKSQLHNFDWKLLGGLIVLFLIGYFIYGFVLLGSMSSSTDLLVSWVLFGGGIFVFIVTRSSLRSLLQIEKFAKQEEHRALHDELTELPNRLLLHDRIAQAIFLAERQQALVAVLFMNLDRFKEVNEALGHTYGDFLLQEVSGRLKKLVRKSDTLARLAGDEFIVVFPCATIENTIHICHNIAEAIERPFCIEGNDIALGVSVGISIYPEHGLESEILLQRAAIAMNQAKRNDNIYAVYEQSHDTSTWDRLVLIGELRNALDENQLVLHYQPKISVKDGRICGAEALIRWRHPTKGFIQPDHFIPIAEQAGLMKSITEWVLTEALCQQAEWKKQNLALSVSVNLSVKNLQDFEFAETVDKLLRHWDTDPALLILEITETTMMVDPDRVKKVVGQLHSLGIKLSIDDYGTGYSSLSYLRKFPAAEIKIDKSFVMNMMRDEDNAVIVKSTIDLVHNIGRQVTAEGVEDQQTTEMLSRLGCDFIQGFHISKPKSPEEFLAWMKKQT